MAKVVHGSCIHMAERYREGIGYSALNTARSALSTTLVLQNSSGTFETHPLVRRFMEGFLKLDLHYHVIRRLGDANVMLKYLSHLGQPEVQNLKVLTYKTFNV